MFSLTSQDIFSNHANNSYQNLVIYHNTHLIFYLIKFSSSYQLTLIDH